MSSQILFQLVLPVAVNGEPSRCSSHTPSGFLTAVSLHQEILLAPPQNSPRICPPPPACPAPTPAQATIVSHLGSKRRQAPHRAPQCYESRCPLLPSPRRLTGGPRWPPLAPATRPLAVHRLLPPQRLRTWKGGRKRHPKICHVGRIILSCCHCPLSFWLAGGEPPRGRCPPCPGDGRGGRGKIRTETCVESLRAARSRPPRGGDVRAVVTQCAHPPAWPRRSGSSVSPIGKSP